MPEFIPTVSVPKLDGEKPNPYGERVTKIFREFVEEAHSRNERVTLVFDAWSIMSHLSDQPEYYTLAAHWNVYGEMLDLADVVVIRDDVSDLVVKDTDTGFITEEAALKIEASATYS